MGRHRTPALAAGLALVLTAGCDLQTTSLQHHELPDGRPADGGSPEDRGDALLRLGQALFFDPELSGNRNISCGSCHVPFLTTAEGLPLSIGEGASGLGPFRTREDASIVRRHTLDLFHRAEMDALFWDGRVQRLPGGQVVGPVPTPVGVTTALELASIVPLLDRDEMRGQAGDIGATGVPNELASLDDDDPEIIWAAIVDRLRSLEGYRVLFSRAFPAEDPGAMHIRHVAMALAHFQEVLWGPQAELFDASRDEEAVRGRTLFFGDAGCVRCHSGELFTDERFHNLAVPQLSPSGALDLGRFEVTGASADRFAFRTPPLRNVALTPPYMHNGTIPTLEEAVRHHFDPVGSLRAYSGRHLPDTLRALLRHDDATRAQIEENVADSAPLRPLRDDEIAAIVTFLESLTNPDELLRHFEDALPEIVPSGLPIDRWNGTENPFRPVP